MTEVVEAAPRKKPAVTVHLHPKQGKAYRSTKRVVYCSSGIQGGKSFVGALKLLWAVQKGWPAAKYRNVSFAVTAPDHKSMIQSTRQAFDRIFYGRGTMHEMEQTFYLKDGRKIFFRTMVKNPWSVEGIPNCCFIWSDEAGQYPRLAYINLQSRTAFMQGQLFLTSTPYGSFWPKRDIIDKWKEGHPDIDYYEWLSVENPAFPKEEYERQKTLLSKREFERKYMGLHTRMEGLIFEDLTDANFTSGKDLDLSQADVYGGIDWGFDHPMALSVRAIMPDKQCYGISFFKGSGLSVTQMLDLIQTKHEAFGVKCWYAGHDRPELILELSNRKIPCVKYFEGMEEYREVDAGNQKLAELIKTKQYRILTEASGVDDLKDEYETYRWDIPESEEQSVGRIKPINVNDDLIAAERYATVGTVHKLIRRKDKLHFHANDHLLRDKWKPGGKPKKSYDAY